MSIAIVILSCRHTIRFPTMSSAPMVNETFHCQQCDASRTVTDSPAGIAEFRWHCTQCRAARKSYGSNRRLAIDDAHTHADRRRHIVEVLCGRESIARVPPRREIELPIR